MFSRMLAVLFLSTCMFSFSAAAAWKAETYGGGSSYPLCDSKDSLSDFSGALNNGNAEMQAHIVNSGSCTLTTQKLTVEVVSQSTFGGWSKIILIGKKWEDMPPVYTVIEAVHAIPAEATKPAATQKEENAAPAVKSGTGDNYTDAEKAIIG